MAREQKAIADLRPDDKVFTPTSRKARALLAIDRRNLDAVKLMFLDTTWVQPTELDGKPNVVDVDAPDTPRETET